MYINCLNKRKHTRKRKGVISAVFDEVLYFNFEHITRDELNEAIILVRDREREREREQYPTINDDEFRSAKPFNSYLI